jgi:hypothetical protein
MLLIGSVVQRMPGPKYTAELDFAELQLREPLPRVSTLRRQRHEAPEGLALALRAPARALTSARGPLRFDAELERGLAWLLEASDALAACAVLLPTPVELTPGQRSRDLLAQFAARLPRTDGRRWVWAPRGPWEPLDRYRFADSLGLACAFDPMLEPVPKIGASYARLQALGTRRNFPEGALQDVLELLDPSRESWVSIESPRAFREAAMMQRLALGGVPD